MRAGVRAGVERELGSRVEAVSALSGGDINEAFAVRLADGGRVFVKTNASADADMFPAEAHGLAWLAEAGALRIPEVLAVDPEFLVLEMIETGRPRGGFDEELGHGLAALHRFGAPSQGLGRDNFIGRLPQENTPSDDWAEFYRTRRLEPMVRSALDAGTLPSSVAKISTASSRGSVSSSVPTSRPGACTEIYGAEISTWVPTAPRASSIRPCMAGDGRSIWR